MYHCLRKQQSRLVPAEAGIQASSHTGGNLGNMKFYFLDSCLRRNDTFWTAALGAGTPLGRLRLRLRRPLDARSRAS